MTAAIDVEAKTLRIERDFRAPLEKVFAALCDPRLAQQWWGPEGMTVSEIEMDAREGGFWRVVMVGSEGGTYAMEGVYKIMEPPVRLVYTWAWIEGGAPGDTTTVDITLNKIEGGTRLMLVHSLFETEEIRDDHQGGWTSSLNCLEAFLRN